MPSRNELKNSDCVKFIKEVEALNPEKRSTLINRLINLHPETPVIEDSSLAILYWYGIANIVLINGDIQNA